LDSISNTKGIVDDLKQEVDQSISSGVKHLDLYSKDEEDSIDYDNIEMEIEEDLIDKKEEPKVEDIPKQEMKEEISKEISKP